MLTPLNLGVILPPTPGQGCPLHSLGCRALGPLPAQSSIMSPRLWPVTFCIPASRSVVPGISPTPWQEARLAPEARIPKLHHPSAPRVCWLLEQCPPRRPEWEWDGPSLMWSYSSLLHSPPFPEVSDLCQPLLPKVLPPGTGTDTLFCAVSFVWTPGPIVCPGQWGLQWHVTVLKEGTIWCHKTLPAFQKGEEAEG